MFLQTHMDLSALRTFHRRPMNKFFKGANIPTSVKTIQSLTKHIKKVSNQRELERTASGGGYVFFMHSPEDLSGKDGDLILVEFCEQHPPLMNEVSK